MKELRVTFDKLHIATAEVLMHKCMYFYVHTGVLTYICMYVTASLSTYICIIAKNRKKIAKIQ